VSIRQLRARLARDESGMGIVEILVALMIFSIVAIGMAASMLSMTRLTADAAARQTATNLAAAEIDRVSAIPDAFTVHDAVVPKQVVVDGITFSVETNTSWVGANGSTDTCGIGGGQLQYKRVRVTVTWDTMYLKNPVRADSALAPSTRINDPSMGTILVSVKRESGDGQQGIGVTAVKTVGVGITEPIAATDVDGCTYVLKAPPGDYTLTLNKTGYITTAQEPFPLVQTITVSAGAATSVDIEADLAHTYTLKYAANSTRTVKLPTNLDVTWFGKATAGPINEPGTGTRKLYPVSGGYQAVAGNPGTCAAVDPERWTGTNGSSGKHPGVRAFKIPASAGGSGTLPVVMGVADVVIPGSSSSQFFLTATAQNVTTGGNPGCATTTVYKFPKYNGGSTQTIALPYGVWKLTTGAAEGSTTTNVTTVTVRDGVVSLNGAGYPVTGVAGGGTWVTGTSLLTFDPRVPR
jgi:type II secretory pathway pseudopilin PulG